MCSDALTTLSPDNVAIRALTALLLDSLTSVAIKTRKFCHGGFSPRLTYWEGLKRLSRSTPILDWEL